jgi:hypothetical protein
MTELEGVLLSKQLTSLKYIYKIDSSRLRNSNWDLSISPEEAFKNEEVVSLADSSVLRFIREIENVDSDLVESEVKQIKAKIKKIKSEKTTTENRNKIKELYSKLFELLFIKSYVCIVMDNNKDFDRLNQKKSFRINGIKFKRLLATTGGAKNSTVIYVDENIHTELEKRINNGRNMTKEFVPAKLEAYKSLACSTSIPVSNPEGVLVVKDCVTKFKTSVIKIDDTVEDYPLMTKEDDHEFTLTESDGYGLILPSLSKKWTKELGENYTSSGFCIRNSFTKGMVFSFDYLDYAENEVKNFIVEDAWGNSQDIRKCQIILTTSMLKLWDSYNSIEHYLKCCEENGYTFSVTKMIPEKLENERNLNYQFIQSLSLSDSNIEDLIYPTATEIHDVLGQEWVKSLLFLKGVHLHEDSFRQGESDFSKALMIDKRMINDPFVKTKIHNMIKKRINDAKVGVLKVKGNFSIVSGDPYSLCQSIFKQDVTGLLKAGEFYSSYWNERSVDKVACFRAPMTCHNNIRILRLKNDAKVNRWYKHMKNVTIFNSWDTTAESLNGLDKDSDSVLTTNNEVILSAIEELDAIVCVQKAAQKVLPTEADLIKANKNSFGDAIGSVTNKITSMFDVRAQFEKGSLEYEELDYRIKCGQNYQQNAIDKSKGIISKDMPKEWYDFKANRIKEDDSEEIKQKKEFNLRILANKKPYFFSYIYPHLMKKYKTYINNANKNSYKRFDLSIDELFAKENKSDEEIEFIKYYSLQMPLFVTDSVMNRICRRIEREFDKVKLSFAESEFDYTILMSGYDYSKGRYSSIKNLYKNYVKEVREYARTARLNKTEKSERRSKRIEFIERFKRDTLAICSNIEELTDIVVDICYKGNNNSKQFAWDICGEQMLLNLLKKNNHTIQYPIADPNGDISFGGENYTLMFRQLEADEFEYSFGRDDSY